MSKPKTLMMFAATALFAMPAIAQDDVMSEKEESPRSIGADFSAADLDQDGALSSDEFVTFSVMRAENGEAEYKDLVLGGEYSAKFNMHDADASGGLTLSEVGGEPDVAPVEDSLEGAEQDKSSDFN